MCLILLFVPFDCGTNLHPWTNLKLIDNPFGFIDSSTRDFALTIFNRLHPLINITAAFLAPGTT